MHMKKIYSFLNGYSFYDYLDYKYDGHMKKHVKDVMNRYYTKRMRVFFKKEALKELYNY